MELFKNYNNILEVFRTTSRAGATSIAHYANATRYTLTLLASHWEFGKININFQIKIGLDLLIIDFIIKESDQK